MKHRNNFNFLRFLFSLLVVIGHSMILSSNFNFQVKFLAMMPNYSVYSFFVISGFLIYASIDQSKNIRKYLINRSKRILPGYIFVVLFFACFLYFISGVSIREYFSLTWLKYVAVNLVFLNFITPCIPYLFEDHITCAVNGSLWTIKVEVIFYFFVPLLFSMIKKQKLKWKNIVLLIIYLLSIAYFYVCVSMQKYVLAKQLPGCLAYFVSGILLYLNLDYFRKKTILFTCLALAIIIIEKGILQISFAFPFALAVIIVAFAYSKIPLQHFAKYGDCSYGMYLIHFPIIQIFIEKEWYKNGGFVAIFSSYAIIIIASFIIWHCIEKPFLRKKFIDKSV